ncbi:MAG: hypothetical protein A4E37_00499 [Methanoregulaceae archaeon PtaB.Bin056]|nr:MAG: hypothetical protein A4E37_00499 [Methanoregulaceae archaeon PtaB.Bin056]
MPSGRREDALSEVIGFILILALIAVLASLYLTYVVPAQGREAEIRHMAEINDQFLGYKTSVDSLWINDQKNVPISRTFTLGTLTGLTQGAFVVPLFQPYPSSGTMVVNGRGETITISADALVQGFPGSATPNLTTIRYEPDHIYVQIMTTNVSREGGLNLSPSSGNWLIWLNITKTYSSQTILIGTIPTFPDPGSGSLKNYIDNSLNNPGGWVSQLQSVFSSTTNSSFFISMTLIKNGNVVFAELPIVKNVQNNAWYTIDILDPGYGLENQLLFPFSLNVSNSTSNWIQYRYPIQVGYLPYSINQSHPLGSLEFQSSNNYWIQQNYYYQQGGVFLQQPDGMVTKVVPLISITNQSGIPYVKIVDVSISGSGNVGGTSPVQVVTKLDSVNRNVIDGSTLAQGIPNARNVTLTVNAQDTATAQMWNSTFAAIRNGAGAGIQNWISSTQTGNQATLSVKNPIPGSDYDIILDYTRVNLTVELQPVAI